MVESKSSAETRREAIVIKLAGILPNSGEAILEDLVGRRFMLALGDIWRNDELIAHLAPSDAFRLGIEWQRWASRSQACH